MPLLIVALAVVLLIFMMTKLKLNGFIALLLTATLVGIWAATTGNLAVDGETVGVSAIAEILEAGIGGQMKSTLVVVGLGAMIGRVMGDAGAARRIASRIVDVFGHGGVQWAMVITSVLIGVTMFYEVAFVIIVPVAFTLVRATKSNLLWVGLPMSITLSTMHSFLPPHPGPTAVAGMYSASVGLTLAYGLIMAVPLGIFVAMVWPRLSFIKKMNPQIPEGLVSEKEIPEEELPPLSISLTVVLFPVIFIAGAALYDMFVDSDGWFSEVINFLGSPAIALLLALLLAMYVFGPRIGRPMTEVAKSAAEAGKAMAMILLVIAGGGAFKEVLVAAGIADYIADMASGWSISPIILAWLIAVILRIALGSATVAVATAAGIAAPLVASAGVSPELMVLATTTGSIAFSHVNDPGFWMFKEYFNLSVTEALKSRTSYTTVLSILGLGAVLLMSLFIS
ncbi:MAG: gluconate:H+ symporter [Ancrocorticia sp.]|uniref:gluconate:H+ symporter n=1 Tax=Ancrocorticia sp. TaxID=2593684 RepID=UPI003F91C3A1